MSRRRFVLEGIDVYRTAHTLDALCRTLAESGTEGVRIRACTRDACSFLARSSIARTRSRASAESWAALEAAREAARRLASRSRRRDGDAVALAAAGELAERLVALLADRARELRGPTGAARRATRPRAA